MNLYFRFFYAVIAAFFFKKKMTDVLGTSRLKFWVLPTDLDLNGHMNNGRYLTIMDIGRMDMVIRTGMAHHVLKHKLMPVLASGTVRYRLPLMPFQSYTLTSRIVAWDEKWAYMEHTFIINGGRRDGAVAAIGILKGSFYDPKNGGTAPTQLILDALGHTEPSPPIPESIRLWKESEEALREEMGQKQ